MHPNIRIEAVQQIVDEVQQNVRRRSDGVVVITGGEPLMHDLDELTAPLHAQGFQTNIETSGSSPFSGNWDWICLSPKKFKPPFPEILPLANELKVVIFNKSDFDWAEKYAARYHRTANCICNRNGINLPVITP